MRHTTLYRVIVAAVGAVCCARLSAEPAASFRQLQGATAVIAWEDLFDLAGGGDEVHRIAIDGNRAYAVGTVANTNGDNDFILRAYDVKSGNLAWQDQLDRANDFDNGSAVAVQGQKVFAGGVSVAPVDGSSYGFLRAYSASGNLLWEALQSVPGSSAGEVDAVAVQADRVFTGGMAESAFAVHAYDSETGHLLWKDAFAGDTTCCPFGQALSIVAHGDRVFAAGWINTVTTGGAFLVRAYDAATGELVWHDQYERGEGFDMAAALAVQGQRLAVVGLSWLDSSSNAASVLRVYSTGGGLLWDEIVDSNDGNEYASAVAIDGEHIYVSGTSANSNFDNDFVVRAFGAKTGVLVWEDRADKGGFEAANALAVMGDEVYVCGEGDGLPIVRAYHGQTGSLLWEDYSVGGSSNDGFLLSVAGSGPNVIVGGRVDVGTGGDFLVRAYNRHPGK